MAFISVSNTFTNGTTADATQVNTNFSDIINGTSDGTKDFNINALTCAGTATFNGAIVLGNAAADTVTVTGTPTFATQLSAALGTVSAPAYSFTGDLNTGVFSSAADVLDLATGGVTRMSMGSTATAAATLGSSTYAIYHYGRINGVTPTAGMVGEVITSGAVQTSFTDTSTTGAWSDGGSLSITAGLWLVQAFVTFSVAGSTLSYCQIGISTTTGNSSSGLGQYENWAGIDGAGISNDQSVVIPNYTINISATTTYYLKIRAGFSGGTKPQWMGSMRAIRIA